MLHCCLGCGSAIRQGHLVNRCQLLLSIMPHWAPDFSCGYTRPSSTLWCYICITVLWFHPTWAMILQKENPSPHSLTILQWLKSDSCTYKPSFSAMGMLSQHGYHIGWSHPLHYEKHLCIFLSFICIVGQSRGCGSYTTFACPTMTHLSWKFQTNLTRPS